MMPLKGKILTISMAFALLTAVAGVGRASPDLAERTGTDTVQTALPSADWPPAQSQPSQGDRVRHAALEPGPVTRSGAAEPAPERQTYRMQDHKAKHVRHGDRIEIHVPRIRIYQPRLRFGGFGFRRRWF